MKKELIIGSLAAFTGIMNAQWSGTNPSPLIANGQLVGIGTNAPSFALDLHTSTGLDGLRIHQNGNSAGMLRFTHASMAALPTIAAHDYGIYSSGAADPNPGSLEIFDNTTMETRLFIQNNGNVGFGTRNTSGSKLHVYDASAVNLLVQSGSSNSDAKVTVGNGWGAYAFLIDNTAIGRISSGTNIMSFRNNGLYALPYQVWIGSDKPQGIHADFNFAVAGKIVAQSVYVTASGTSNWADYVFADDYKLPTLKEVESFYRKNKHLSEIPTAEDVKENGINVGEMHVLLLKKVEELTLYVVDLNKQVEALQLENKKLRGDN